MTIDTHSDAGVQASFGELASDAQGGVRFQGRSQARRLAAIVRGLIEPNDPFELQHELGKFAAALGNCGQVCPHISGARLRIARLYCRRHQVCDLCCWIRSRQNGRDDAMRTLLARDVEPSLRFALVSLVVPEASDLRPQLQQLRNGIRALRSSCSMGAPVVRGLIWQIEICRGQSLGYRAHVHAIAAVSDSGWDAQLALMKCWVQATQPQLSGRAFIRNVARQHIESFWSETDCAENKQGSDLELARDAYRISIYASKPPKLNDRERLRVYALVNGDPLRGTQGVFRKFKRVAMSKRLRALGGEDCLIRTRTVQASDCPRDRQKLRKLTRLRRKEEMLLWRSKVMKSLGESG